MSPSHSARQNFSPVSGQRSAGHSRGRKALIRHAGRVLTHRQILREVWDPKAEEHREYLRVYFTHLRKKVERNATKPEIIINEPGVGYRLRLES